MFADLVPYVFGLALTPAAIATTILMLGAEEAPVAKAVAYAVPFALLYSTFAFLVLIIARAADEPAFSPHDKAMISLVVGLFLIFLGVAAIARHRRRPEGGQVRKGLLTHVDDIHPPLAFAVGLTMALLNPNVPIPFGGLAEVASADVSGLTRVLGAAFLVLGSEVGLAGPIAWYIAVPERVGGSGQGQGVAAGAHAGHEPGGAVRLRRPVRPPGLVPPVTSPGEGDDLAARPS